MEGSHNPLRVRWNAVVASFLCLKDDRKRGQNRGNLFVLSKKVMVHWVYIHEFHKFWRITNKKIHKQIQKTPQVRSWKVKKSLFRMCLSCFGCSTGRSCQWEALENTSNQSTRPFTPPSIAPVLVAFFGGLDLFQWLKVQMLMVYFTPFSTSQQRSQIDLMDFAAELVFSLWKNGIWWFAFPLQLDFGYIKWFGKWWEDFPGKLRAMSLMSSEKKLQLD